MIEQLNHIHQRVLDSEYLLVFGCSKPNLADPREPSLNMEEEEEEEQPKESDKFEQQVIEHHKSILNDDFVLRELQVSDECVLEPDAMEFSDMEEPVDQVPVTKENTNPSQRQLRQKKQVNYLIQSKFYQPHSYVKYRYLKRQPFTFYIHLDAYLILTMHSHLSRAEVIGLMGGTYCRETREIRIQKIIPCRNIPTKDDLHNVEMDPMSNLMAQHEFDRLGLKNMGWYHSHPIFKTTPSFIDQRSHEFLSKQYEDHVYFGLIMCPFKTPQIDSICDSFLFFCLNKEVVKLELVLQPVASISLNDINHLAEIYNNHMAALNPQHINAKWKYKLTNLEKMIGAIKGLIDKNIELSAEIDPFVNEGAQQVPFDQILQHLDEFRFK